MSDRSGSYVAELTGVTHRYGRKSALSDVTLSLPAGCMVGLIGPDGVGKSTLMGLIAGARKLQEGTVEVLDGDMTSEKHRNRVYPHIAYMPQGLGKNLYMDLSIHENLQFFARLFGLSRKARKVRIDRLLRATGLLPFKRRPAGKLSGGMKQKLGLCCALIHDPDLLILDEPTTGVDPLSRQQFWILIDEIRKSSPNMSVLVSTAYMEEADRFDWLVAMNDGKVLATGTPSDLKAQTGCDSLEDTFIRLLPGQEQGSKQRLVIPPLEVQDGEVAIEARNLTRRFGNFTAVDDVSFEIQRGEIFGFLGSNGCGKTTTMKMLTGLLPASEGEAFLFGSQVKGGDMKTRERVGYMSQSFSLYRELTVRQNLVLHGRLFNLSDREIKARIKDLVARFTLEKHLDDLTESLPLGVRQRLSLAVAVIHEPEMLILDEPTSGVDPIARDEFWKLLIDLSRNQNVTIFISTHFMNEALRCDRVSLMHDGKVLACDTPDRLMQAKNTESFEDAFIDYIRETVGEEEAEVEEIVPAEAAAEPGQRKKPGFFRLSRLLTYSYREYLEIIRDPIRLAFAFGGTALLYIVFGYGISADVTNLRYAALDLDNSPESRAYVEQFRGSRYFREVDRIYSAEEAETLLQGNKASLVVEIPPDFGRDLSQGKKPEVAAWIDGAMPDQAETIKGYVQGLHRAYLDDYSRRTTGEPLQQLPVDIVIRYSYNPSFESIYAMVPAIPTILLFMVPAILMAVSVVREKELGSINNFYVTPVTRLEFLLGKQLPYIIIFYINTLMLLVMALFLFQVPVKGSLTAFLIGSLFYVTVTTGFGLMISAFVRSQIAAIFATAILAIMPTIQFSGLTQPVSTLQGRAELMGHLWPAGKFLHLGVGSFTKALSLEALAPDLLRLMVYVPVFLTLAVIAMKKQEK
ncbi:ribosome-associated ATPase/putative transporter RbbA [Emcibacter nanhaiensis]|uniref:ATP-binding cassette domain-containing protein n=1 Tax=Emcibacter nanhaiensis TaxID=1505037 RepID=A0A501PMV9_9PROT|nr:ribosome-associated ATPase/putative transporter RbbA [Emcibacter nanhaiensis]TPD61783.1 ATP-binding cassette domain-containing protein [Emcibacter nanhaiensis]